MARVVRCKPGGAGRAVRRGPAGYDSRPAGTYFAVELRYTERLCGRDVTSYDDIHVQSIDEIFDLRANARKLLREYLAGMTETDAAAIITFATMTAGTLTASKHKIASNIFIHAIRHWAQIATTLRTAGFTKQWGHDVLLSDLAM